MSVLPVPPDGSTPEEIRSANLHPAFRSDHHSPGFEVLPNGDLLAVFYSVTQVLVYRWALTSWPENVEPAAAPAADPGEDRGSLRFDPRAITLAAALAFGLLLSGTDWTLLAAIETLFLVPVFLVTFFLQEHLLRGVTFGTVKK